jgi:hypothetical protein
LSLFCNCTQGAPLCYNGLGGDTLPSPFLSPFVHRLTIGREAPGHAQPGGFVVIGESAQGKAIQALCKSRGKEKRVDTSVNVPCGTMRGAAYVPCGTMGASTTAPEKCSMWNRLSSRGGWGCAPSIGSRPGRCYSSRTNAAARPRYSPIASRPHYHFTPDTSSPPVEREQ